MYIIRKCSNTSSSTCLCSLKYLNIRTQNPVTDVLEQRLTNYSLRPQAVLVKTKFYWNISPNILSMAVFKLQFAELSHCDRGYMDYKA